MQGSVIKYEGKRGVTWTYVVDVGRDTKGKRIQKWRRGFKTKKDAEAAMQLELHSGALALTSRRAQKRSVICLSGG